MPKTASLRPTRTVLAPTQTRKVQCCAFRPLAAAGGFSRRQKLSLPLRRSDSKTQLPGNLSVGPWRLYGFGNVGDRDDREFCREDHEKLNLLEKYSRSRTLYLDTDIRETQRERGGKRIDHREMARSEYNRRKFNVEEQETVASQESNL